MVEELSRDEQILLEEYRLASENTQSASDSFWDRFNIFNGLNLALLTAYNYCMCLALVPFLG